MFSRIRIIKIWVVYCFLVFASTEFLSVFDLIDRSVFIGMYLIGTMLFLALIIRRKPKIKVEWPKYWRWYLLLILTIFLPLLLIALYYPPNNYDSMTYHLPRVEHWIQNKNVEFYTTNNSRQLFMSPLAEYVILHWRILVGEDNLVNLVQYVSMILSVIVATLVVKEWKGNKLTELLAATLVATIPMGIMQATSTQNDYVTAFFAIASLYFYLRNDFLFLALSIGLGIFTKSTFIIFVLPLGLYWFVTWIRKDGWLVWKRVGLILFFTILINGAQWYRNYEYFGSMFGPKDMSEAMFNTSFAPKYIVSNIVRNIGTQIGLPNKKYNTAVDNIVEGIHQKLGVKSNDFVNSWFSEKYVTQFAIHEDLSGNLVVFVLFLIAGIVLIFKRYSVWSTYLVMLMGWILFNGLLKWQPWQSRLELPFFVVSCPMIAAVLVKLIKNSLRLKVFVLLLTTLAIPFVVGYLTGNLNNNVINTSNRPITQEMLSFKRPRFERVLLSGVINSDYYGVVKKIKELGANTMVLDLGGNSWEYPLYVSLRYEELAIKVDYKNGEVLLTDKEMTNYGVDMIEVLNTNQLKMYILPNL